MAENAKKSFEERAAAAPTALHEQFAEWIFVQTGVKVDVKTVQLVTTLRHDFQRSEENQTSLKARKEAAAKKRADAAKAKRERLQAQLAKIQADLAEETAAVEPATKPAPKKAPAKRTAAKPAPVAAAEPAKAVEAPAQPAKPARRTRRTTVAKTTTPASK